MSTSATEASPDAQRQAMITKIKDAGYTLTFDVEHALRSVERHLFAPGVPVDEAYANDIVVTKRSADDQVLSCLSQPSIVALQLGQLDVQPGHRVLEIGAGSGYNAALLAHLAGPGGHVTAIDVDADIVEEARERLAVAGVTNVDVVLGDGALGHPSVAPYDRIVATVGVYGIPDACLRSSLQREDWWLLYASVAVFLDRSPSSAGTMTMESGAASTIRCAALFPCGRAAPPTRGESSR